MKKILLTVAVLVTGFSYGQSLDFRIKSLLKDSITYQSKFDSIYPMYLEYKQWQEKYIKTYKQESDELKNKIDYYYDILFHPPSYHYETGYWYKIYYIREELKDLRRLKKINYGT